MIRRSPAEYYIKYLLLRPENYDDEDIIEVLAEHQLDYPGGDYLDRLRKRLVKPETFYPLNEEHQASYRVLVRERVHTMFFMDPRTRGALALLNSPKDKEVIEAMTIVQDPPALVAHRLAGMGTTTNVGAVKRYLHYFWNVDLVDHAELRALLDIRTQRVSLNKDDKESRMVESSLQRARWNDSRNIAIASPSPEMASMRLQLRHGIMPNKMQLAKMIESGIAVCAVALNEEGLKGTVSRDNAQNMRDYAVALRNLKELQLLIGDPGGDLAKDLQRLALDTDGTELPHVDELNGPPIIPKLPEAQHERETSTGK